MKVTIPPFSGPEGDKFTVHSPLPRDSLPAQRVRGTREHNEYVLTGDFPRLSAEAQTPDGTDLRLTRHATEFVIFPGSIGVKRRIENPLGFAWSKDNVVEISPAVGFVDTVVGNNNLIVHQLLEQQATRYPILLTLFRKAGGTTIVSLRSRNGEALKVAEQLQGGGHPNACGATLPRSVQNISEAIDYLRKVLNPYPTKGSPLNSLESLFDAVDLQRK
jgi:hypothetical protein